MLIPTHRGERGDAGEQNVAAAIHTNVDAALLRRRQIGDPSFKHVERADAFRARGRQHDIASGNVEAQAPPWRREKVRHADETFAGAHQSQIVMAVMTVDDASDQRASLPPVDRKRGGGLAETAETSPAAFTRPSSSTTTRSASRATSATEWLT